jgi:hypothetical protein
MLRNNARHAEAKTTSNNRRDTKARVGGEGPRRRAEPTDPGAWGVMGEKSGPPALPLSNALPQVQGRKRPTPGPQTNEQQRARYKNERSWAITFATRRRRPRANKSPCWWGRSAETRRTNRSRSMGCTGGKVGTKSATSQQCASANPGQQTFSFKAPKRTNHKEREIRRRFGPRKRNKATVRDAWAV